ncbi:MAG: hydroxymethylbilane synthase [Planctomycetaceae bacterium]|nr:hydroxymethylbilane synthase [Planctomycetaceae bacterium]
MKDDSNLTLRLGTRSSALALWQANWVTEQLATLGVKIEIVHIKTSGDVRSGPIGQLGAQGVFTKEIQRSLLEGQIDLAVHSLKDLPTETVEGLELVAVPERESSADVLVSRISDSLETLPEGSRIGTGSVRRQAQLLAMRPDLSVCDIRGNVGTRLRKLEEQQYDALILAEAGLRRLGLDSHITQIIPRSVMLPAVGQGALGIETRAADVETRAVVEQLNDRSAHHGVMAERSLLAALRGGCSAPVGAAASLQGDSLSLQAVVLSLDGTVKISSQQQGPISQAVTLGKRVADALFEQGAEKLLQSVRDS